MRSKSLAISFAIFVPAMVAIGGYFGTVITPFLLIGAIVAVVILVALNKISGWQIYLYLFGMALGLVWQSTMLGVNIIGSDIHIEFYYAQLNAQQPWDLTRLDASNTSIVIGLIAPWISKLSHLDMVWVFKAILPMFLASIPLVLFATFKKMFGEKRAFFATMFFMIVPVFSMEIAQIAKSMAAELFFALMIYVMVMDWKWQYKLAGISSTLIMQILCHYTIGTLGICFLLGVFIFRLVTTPIKWQFWANKKVPIFVLTICLILSVGTFWGYYNYVGKAVQLKAVQEVIMEGLPNFKYPSETPPIPPLSENILPPSDISGDGATDELLPPSDFVTVPKEPENGLMEQMDRQPTLVRLGTGFDFWEVPKDGKLFRLIQFLTEALILMGIGRFIYTYRKHKAPAEFIGLIVASGVLLFYCIFRDGFAMFINMTRFYHITLFVLAPMFVLGCETLGSIRLKR